MASRLVLKYGLVSEQDRLSTSADALLVSEPTTGSKTRTKGSLYLIVTSREPGSRTSDATRLVADTIRREYYYDESAGIAIVMEKAIRSANRRLRHSREGSPVADGSLGIAAAVVRGNELYVATNGDADAYLVRSARLLMPEHEPTPGLPAPDPVHVGVWRGEFAVGDSLLLCARNLVNFVGTEELKNAVVTLHPQSAVEHLHHLFVAAGGDGSDAVLAIEASEVALSRVEHRLVPVTPAEPLAGAPVRSPIPLADQFQNAATAMQDSAVAMRSLLRENVNRTVDRLVELMPQRRTAYRRITPAATRRETQRRAALALLSFLGVVAFLAVALWWWSGMQPAENPRDQVTEGEAAYAQAVTSIDRVFGPQYLLHTQTDVARQQLRDAWAALDRAATAGVDASSVARQRERAAAGLDFLYGTHPVRTTQAYTAPAGSQVTALVRGPDGAAYLIVDRSVVRVDPDGGDSVTVVQPGDGEGEGIGAARLLANGGPDLLIVDIRGDLWRWRPSDSEGGGTLGGMRVAGTQAWGRDIIDIAAFGRDAVRPELYSLYVPYPPESQILRYDPVAEGSGFIAPAPYLINRDDRVSDFRQLYIDGDVYALVSEGLLRYFGGTRSTFELDDPPDSGDLRPGHDYGRLAATGTRGLGLLMLWDRTHQRLVTYNKSDRAYLGQYVGAPGEPALDDVRGMYLLERGESLPPVLVWAGPTGLFVTVLDDSSAEPGATTVPDVGTPAPSATPAGPSAEPTERPRRTPRQTPSP
jgi:hypothetical protein